MGYNIKAECCIEFYLPELFYIVLWENNYTCQADAVKMYLLLQDIVSVNPRDRKMGNSCKYSFYLLFGGQVDILKWNLILKLFN